MVASANGWIANNISVTANRPIPGTGRTIRVRFDAPGTLLLEVAAAFHRWVEPIDGGQLDDWGYAERPIRGGTALSNHASGTAIDLNAVKHPMGTEPLATFTAQQVDICHQIVAATGNVVRWGGDYGDPAHGGVRGGRFDSMHWEINDGRDMADCERALRTLRAWPGPSQSGLRRGSSGPEVTKLQTILNTRFPKYSHLVIDGVFGAGTEAVVREFQQRSSLPVTGVVDGATRRALGM